MIKYYIFSPNLSQSMSITKLLKRYYQNSILVGVLFPNESLLGISKLYDSIISLSDSTSYDDGVIIPTGSISTKYFLEKGDISIGSIIMRNSSINVFDKIWILKQACDVSIPTPKTWKNLNNTVSYPLFYKQSYEQGKGARGVAKKKNDVPSAEGMIFQEFIDSKGTYGVGFIAQNGVILTNHIHYESESYPKAGGSAVIIEDFEDDRLLDYTRRLVAYLNYSGWGLAEYKYCPQRRDYVFMEINAKFWASCEFSFINQPKFIKLLFDIDSEEEHISRMIFVERAFSRGIPFVLSRFPLLLSGSKLLFHSGDLIRIISKLVPKSFRKLIKKVVVKNG